MIQDIAPVPLPRDAAATDRIWSRLASSISPARRRRHLLIGVLAVCAGLLAAGGGAIAYAAHTQSVVSKTPTFGDPDYASSFSEERALGEVARVAARAGAIGFWRNDATTIFVRVPSSSDLVGSTQIVRGFQLNFVASQFTRQSLRETRARVENLAWRVSDAGSGFLYDYYPDRDAVVVGGHFSAAATLQLDAIPGVVAQRGGLELQEGRQPDIRPDYTKFFFGLG